MKSFHLKISFVLLVLCFMVAGCEKDEELFWEISPNTINAIIQKEVDGIEFKFCLLNEQGEPATVFTEGDNFSFFFSVTNRTNRNLSFDPGFAYSKDIGFCTVYNSESENLGKPYNVISVVDIGPAAYPYEIGKSYIFQQPWADARESTWDWQYGLYESTKRERLTLGSYYTEFKYKFKFAGDIPIQTDTLSFKIKFKIQ